IGRTVNVDGKRENRQTKLLGHGGGKVAGRVGKNGKFAHGQLLPDRKLTVITKYEKIILHTHAKVNVMQGQTPAQWRYGWLPSRLGSWAVRRYLASGPHH